MSQQTVVRKIAANADDVKQPAGKAFRGNGRPWLPEHDQFIIDNWDAKSVSDIAAALDRDAPGVSRRAKRLGLPMKLKRFTEEEDAFLRQHYGRAKQSWVAKQLCRSDAVIAKRAATLRITR